MGSRLHVVNLRHSAVDICCRDDDIRIIRVLAETVSGRDGAEVSRGDDVGCRSNGRLLDDAGLYLTQCGRLTTVVGAVRVAVGGSTRPASYICDLGCASGRIY